VGYVIVIAAALILGAYTLFGFHYYTILISRTTNPWFRLGLATGTVALVIFLPGVGWGLLLGAGPNPSAINARMVWIGVTFSCWMGPMWIYIIRNWEIVNSRLDRSRRTKNGHNV
jgi:hypothetical protein